jgi:hypothetical protein
MLDLRSMQQVPENPCIFGDLDANCVFDCPHRGQGMDVRSDPAGSCDEVLRIAWIPPLKDQLDPPKHLPGAPGIDNFSTGHLDFDPEVTFDSGDRINDDSFTHMISSLM